MYRLPAEWPQLKFTRIIDSRTELAVLLIEFPDDRAPVVAKLGELLDDRVTIASPVELTPGTIQQFMHSRHLLLETGAEQ